VAAIKKFRASAKMHMRVHYLYLQYVLPACQTNIDIQLTIFSVHTDVLSLPWSRRSVVLRKHT